MSWMMIIMMQDDENPSTWNKQGHRAYKHGGTWDLHELWWSRYIAHHKSMIIVYCFHHRKASNLTSNFVIGCLLGVC